MTQKVDFHHYLPVTDNTMHWGIYLTGAGRALNPSTDDYPFEKQPAMYHIDSRRGRTLPEFQAILITDGRGTFESEPTGTVDIRDGTLIFLFPGVWHRYRPVGAQSWAERWISYNGDISYRLLEQGLITPRSAVLSAGDAPLLVDAFDRLLDKVYADPLHNPVLLSMHALGLLATVIESAVGKLPAPQAKSRKDQDSLVSDVVDVVWTSSHQALSIPQVCKTLGVNRRTLERRFREARGHTILQEIANCRCSRAKRFLLETDLPIKSVSYLAGFSSEDRFRATFEKIEGMPPSVFREKYGRREV